MKRAFGVLTVFFLLTAFATSLDRGAQSTTTQAAGLSELHPVAHPSRASSVTIVFRGLMIFHPDPERQYFEVGILLAPDHEFRIQVRENSPNGVSIFSVPLAQFGTFQRDLWLLEFPGSTSQGVSFYQGGPFDRARGTGDERDARWLIDLEGPEFYQREVPIDGDKLSVVLRMSGGEFYTKKQTLPLMRRKGDGKYHYFGRFTDELATDVLLREGDLVLRSREAGREILRLKKKPDTSYRIVIENSFVGDHHMASGLNHFRYHYELISIPETEWYEFRVVNGSDFSRAKFAHSDFAKFAHTNYLSPGPNPFLCGIGKLGRRNAPLRQ